MCGRFYIDLHHKETQQILSRIEDRNVQLQFGDVYPNSVVPVLTAEETIAAKWGFARIDKKGVLINARAETVIFRRMFRNSFMERRCLVPANGFYEWDHDKHKRYFTRENDALLYLCGFYRTENKEPHFIILTKNATPPVSAYHHRIPVFADGEDKRRYLTDAYFASDYISEGAEVNLQCK